MSEAKRFGKIKFRGFYTVSAAILLITCCQAKPQGEVTAAYNLTTVAPTTAPQDLSKDPPTQVKSNSNLKIKFSSVYTKLDSKTCEPISKAKSEEDEIPLICKGYKDYKIFLGEHGLNPPMYIGREISKDLDAWNPLDFPTFNGAEMGQTIEWRLADGEPFAFIIRAEYNKQDFDTNEKGKVSQLIVQNLKGFAQINVSIDALKTNTPTQMPVVPPMPHTENYN